jgi:hypothetical protein
MTRATRLPAFGLLLLSMWIVPAKAESMPMADPFHATRLDASGSLLQGSLQHVIDFETPKLEPTQGRLTINPYVDPGTGVSFSSPPWDFGQGEVGLVINGQTSACVQGDLFDQKLGTGPLGAAAVGLSGFPIRADFPRPLLPPSSVSVQFQTVAGAAIRLRLFDAAGNVIGEANALAGPPAEGCGFPGASRAVQQLTAASDQPVSYATMDMPQFGYVYVIDDFIYSSAGPEQLAVDVDLDPNVINLDSHAPWVTAYVEPSGFDPANIDLTTLRLATSVPAVSKFALVGDHNANGFPDLMVKFAREALDPLLTVGVNRLELTGSLTTGESFTGADSVMVIDPPTTPLSASVAPNPLNPAGVLAFVTSKPGRVKVTMFDVNGRLVRTLVDSAFLERGSHKVSIDGRDRQGNALATGVFFYRVETVEGSASGRIAIVK